MAEYLPPVVAQLTGDIGDFLTKLAEAEAALSSLGIPGCSGAVFKIEDEINDGLSLDLG